MLPNWPWWVYSVMAAVVWGLHFNLVVKVSSILPRDISTPLTLLIFSSIPIVMLTPFIYQKMIGNIDTILAADNSIRISAILLIFTTLIAASLLYIAMQFSNNAIIASLIDISYPIFLALFAWLIFKGQPINLPTIFGGLLIFAGSVIIILNQK